MKRKPPKAPPTHADSTGDIKADLTQEQLAAFGAAALAYNVLEDQIDALLFIVTRIPDWLFSEVSSRIHGLDGKVAIIQEAVSIQIDRATKKHFKLTRLNSGRVITVGDH